MVLSFQGFPGLECLPPVFAFIRFLSVFLENWERKESACGGLRIDSGGARSSQNRIRVQKLKEKLLILPIESLSPQFLKYEALFPLKTPQFLFFIHLRMSFGALVLFPRV